MRKGLILLLMFLMRAVFWLRYRVTVQGLELLTPANLNKLGGVLFLPNHPTFFIDPVMLTIAIWKEYPFHPVVVDYLYEAPLFHKILKLMNALSIPEFINSSDSQKKNQADEVFEAIIAQLKQKKNFLLYPAGKTKEQAQEVIGASGLHRILQSVPEVNIVLVRTIGLWGSRFSRALTGGATPPLFETIMWGIKNSFKNLLFFTPRRQVTIELLPAGTDFPYHGSRVEINRYLEKWYNRPDGILAQQGEEPGESLYLVSYSIWRQELPKMGALQEVEDEIEMESIPLDIQDEIRQKLYEMTQVPMHQIEPKMRLVGDLGLDSMDTIELLVFLEKHFEVANIPMNELTTVEKIMAFAAKAGPRISHVGE